jgi:choline dehydrogenase-like flavoprotein
MRQLSHTSVIGILLRDRFGGRITVNRHGVPVISYRLSPYDQQHMRRGIEGAARVLLAAGARDIFSTQNRLVELRARSQDTVEAWLRRVDRVGYGPNQTVYCSFHQMGTCRMGSDPRTSVVDGAGEAHRVKNLFVADGSLFPSASGVNPMVTIAAFAHYVAQQIKARL